MAGTFGYEAEHYELSMKVGERLFREMRPLRPSDTSPKYDINNSNDNVSSPVVFGGGRVGATGAACRMQIEQGTGVDAEHPIMLIAKALLVDRGRIT
jgi:Fe-S oxidoreductase